MMERGAHHKSQQFVRRRAGIPAQCEYKHVERVRSLVAGFEDSGRWLQAKECSGLQKQSSPQFTTSKKMRILILQLQVAVSANNPNEWEIDSPSEPSERNTGLPTIQF